ncbi:MAG: hypothetical protein EOP39_15330 [Rubrivivax sp.]|nr:MAG: hypothetical protein EOP39_15330 [Rubrivivax sp.]
MPFNDVDKVKDHAQYKSVLKAELPKTGEAPVKYHYFEKFKFTGGGKDGEPFLAVGGYGNTFIDDLKSTGAVYKARGRMIRGEDQLLHFTVEHGTVKEATLNVVLKEVTAKASLKESLGSDSGKAELANEPMAKGEVVRNKGGQGEGSDGSWAKAKATHDKLVAVVKLMGDKLPKDTSAKVVEALKAFEIAAKRLDLTAAERELGEARMRLDSFNAKAKSVKEKDVDVEMASQSSNYDNAETDVADLPAQITALGERVTSLNRTISGLEKSEAKKRGASWQKDWNAKDGEVKAATTLAQKLATRLANAKDLTDDKSDKAKTLRTTLKYVLAGLKQAQDDLRDLSVDPDLSSDGPDKLRASPGLAQAREAIAPIVPNQLKRAELFKEVALEVRKLRKRYDAIKDALDSDCEAPLEALEQKVDQLLKHPPQDDKFHGKVMEECQSIEKWLEARDRLLKLVKARDVDKSYKAQLQKNSQDGLLINAKKRLDDMVKGTVTPTDKQIQTVMVIVAPKNDEEWLARSNFKDASTADAAKWGDNGLSNSLLKQVWKNSANAAKAGDQPKTITGFSLENVEVAIKAWQAARNDAPLAVSNMHVPGRGRPQYKADKNVTRREIQANFISFWNGKQINQHVDIATCSDGPLYNDEGRVIEALINKLADAKRLNRS